MAPVQSSSRAAQAAGRACILCTGCPENRIDGAEMRELLLAESWEMTDDHREADFVIYVSCALTSRNEELSLDTVRRLQREMRSDARLVVCGCLDKINPARLREVYEGPIFGSDEISVLADMIGARGDGYRANYLLPRASLVGGMERALSSYRAAGLRFGLTAVLDRLYTRRLNAATTESRDDAYCIKVSTGCDNTCAYCAVRLSRGMVRSKPIAAVAQEFDDGLRQGHRHIALIGTDLGSYGHDRGKSLTDLLHELLQRDGDYDLRLRNVHPRYIIRDLPALCDIVRSGRISHLSTAVQSGSDEVLARMRRGYRAAEFGEALEVLRGVCPGLELRTQVLIGFPGETEEQFEDTLRFIDAAPFDYTEVYLFEPRPGTLAETMPRQIPRHVAARRRNRMYLHALWRSVRNRVRHPEPRLDTPQTGTEREGFAATE